MSRYLRWQAAIALLGILLLGALLSYAAYNFTSVTVPDRGGVFVEGVAGNPQFLNPLLSQYNRVDADLCVLLFNGLTRLDEQGVVVPDLAQTWSVSPDGLTYDFVLRSGMSWQDGMPVTASDALYTVSAMQNPEFPGAPWLGALWRAVKISAPDGPEGLTVRFKLEQPLAPFLNYTTIGLLPAHLWESVPVARMMQSEYNTRPIGTGPWQVSRITASRVELAPNPYSTTQTPYLAGLTVRFYPDHQSLLPAYDRGEIDGVSWIWPEDMVAATNRKDLQILSAPMSGYSLIYLNQQNPNVPFFKELAVRQALLYAIDRQGLVDTNLRGQGLVANSPILPGTWASEPSVTLYEYSPDKGNQALEDAGWKDSNGDGVREKDGKKLAFILLGSDQQIIETIAQAWALIGVKATPQLVTLTGMTTDFLAPRTYEAALVHWELEGDPDPYPLWHSTQIKDGQNYAGWNDRVTDEVIEKTRSTIDPIARKEYFAQFERRFADQVPALLLYHPVYTYGIRSKVHDVQVGPLNSSGERLRDVSRWYILTRRITVGSGATRLDTLP